MGSTTTLAADTTATNVNLSGTLSVSGQTTIGGHILPDTNDAYDIGSPEFKIRDMYVSDNSLWIGDTTKISNVNGSLKFRKRKINVVPKAIVQAGAHAGHANEAATTAAALAHAGVSSVDKMKMQHWHKFMRTLNAAAKITDIFRENDDDYEETSASDAWKEISDTKIYTNTNVGIGTSDPDTALHVKGSFKLESEDDGFQLIRSTVGAADPQLIIDTKNFGVDDSIEDKTGQNCTKFTKLYRVHGTNSEGYGRDWYWGLANDEYTNISLAVGGESGGNDPDLAFTFTTTSELYCNKVYAALGGNADTATRLATPRKINGVDFDGTQDITIEAGGGGGGAGYGPDSDILTCTNNILVERYKYVNVYHEQRDGFSLSNGFYAYKIHFPDATHAGWNPGTNFSYQGFVIIENGNPNSFYTGMSRYSYLTWHPGTGIARGSETSFRVGVDENGFQYIALTHNRLTLSQPTQVNCSFKKIVNWDGNSG